MPVHDDRLLFEFLILEGAQAGLSWETILRKREAYRAAFEGFDPAVVARFTPRRIERLLKDPGIIRTGSKSPAPAAMPGVPPFKTNSGVSMTTCGGLLAVCPWSTGAGRFGKSRRRPESPTP